MCGHSLPGWQTAPKVVTLPYVESCGFLHLQLQALKGGGHGGLLMKLCPLTSSLTEQQYPFSSVTGIKTPHKLEATADSALGPPPVQAESGLWKSRPHSVCPVLMPHEGYSITSIVTSTVIVLGHTTFSDSCCLLCVWRCLLPITICFLKWESGTMSCLFNFIFLDFNQFCVFWSRLRSIAYEASSIGPFLM